MKKSVVWVLLLGMAVLLCACGNSHENAVQLQDTKTGTLGTEDEEESKMEKAQTAENYAKPEMKGEITVSCFFEDEFLTTAADKFMESYPEVTVTINAFNQTTDSASVENYQTFLNTKLMSGKAEDIILNSFLPVTKYSRMGVFEDLRNYISQTPEWTEENYFMNVITSAEEKDGAIYLLPYTAKFDAVGFSQELLSQKPGVEKELQNKSFGECMDIAKRMYMNTEKSNAFLIQLNDLSYANYLIEDSLRQFLDTDSKTANINSEDYIRLIQNVKELSEEDAFGRDVDFYNGEYYYAATRDYDVQAAFYEVDNMAPICCSRPVTDRDGNIAINANTCFVMNSASKNKPLAWEFMKYLLSEEMQSQPSVHGLAVNKKGFEAAVERYHRFYTENGNKSVDKAQYQALLKDWMEQVNDCDTTDATLWTLIEEENAAFFQGRQDAETTASVLQRKVEQYFNE